MPIKAYLLIFEFSNVVISLQTLESWGMPDFVASDFNLGIYLALKYASKIVNR